MVVPRFALFRSLHITFLIIAGSIYPALCFLGLCVLCSAADSYLLAFPGRQPGHIHLVDLARLPSNSSMPSSRQSSAHATPLSQSPNDLDDFFRHHHRSNDPIRDTSTHSYQISIIPAHTSMVSCMSLNFDGSLLASTSVKGTLIRIFNTATGKQVQEFRRGADRADIWSISFNADSSRICIGSDKGTIHVFNLQISSSSQSASPSAVQRIRFDSPGPHGSLTDESDIQSQRAWSDTRRSSVSSVSQLGTSPGSTNVNRQSRYS
jgi:WD40 repeat protein